MDPATITTLSRDGHEPIQPRGWDWRAFLRKLWAPFAGIGLFLAKFGGVLLKFKFLFGLFMGAQRVTLSPVGQDVAVLSVDTAATASTSTS